MIVEGGILDADGFRRAYVRFESDHVVETGVPGTDSTRGRERRVRGLVVPRPVNGHTHLGDAVARVEPPHRPASEIVRPPDGLKFRLLAAATAGQKRRAMAAALERMRREGVAATIDFREEGVVGVRLLLAAAKSAGVEAVALGRPLRRPLDVAELESVLQFAAGVGLSGVKEEAAEVRSRVAAACRTAGKLFALHASEEVRESPDDYLDPRPDLLIHLTEATEDDIEQVRDAKVTVGVCPRSNALFGKRPHLDLLEKLGVRTMIGTDNAMFHAPSIWRELEFAYVSGRLAQRPVTPEFLFRCAFVEPWRFLGREAYSRVEAGSPGRPLVVRVPLEDPAYQIVARATEHLILSPAPGGRGAG